MLLDRNTSRFMAAFPPETATLGKDPEASGNQLLVTWHTGHTMKWPHGHA